MLCMVHKEAMPERTGQVPGKPGETMIYKAKPARDAALRQGLEGPQRLDSVIQPTWGVSRSRSGSTLAASRKSHVSEQFLDRLAERQHGDWPARGVEVLRFRIDAQVLVNRGQDVLRRLGVGLGECPSRVGGADHPAPLDWAAGQCGAEDVGVVSRPAWALNCAASGQTRRRPPPASRTATLALPGLPSAP